MRKIGDFKLLLSTKLLMAFLAVLFSFGIAHAEELGLGAAKPWQLNFQKPASPVMEQFYALHNMLLVVITGISVFVLILLVVICVKFSEKRNPTPSSTTHNTKLEIIWTLVPVLILVAIAVPSLKSLYFANKFTDTEMTLKVVGHQWYWEYIYPDADNMKFDSVVIKDPDIKKEQGQLRLLEVDNRVFVPVNTKIRVLITAADVIHSWAVPSFGVKKDAVPGRLNETWFSVNKPGVYYGQCSELCGIDHGYMPIVVQAVSKEDYAAWLAAAKQKFASDAPQKGKAIAALK